MEYFTKNIPKKIKRKAHCLQFFCYQVYIMTYSDDSISKVNSKIRKPNGLGQQEKAPFLASVDHSQSNLFVIGTRDK